MNVLIRKTLPESWSTQKKRRTVTEIKLKRPQRYNFSGISERNLYDHIMLESQKRREGFGEQLLYHQRVKVGEYLLASRSNREPGAREREGKKTDFR